jgi:hypothetical protein
VCDTTTIISLKPTMKPQFVEQIICTRVLDLKKKALSVLQEVYFSSPISFALKSRKGSTTLWASMLCETTELVHLYLYYERTSSSLSSTYESLIINFPCPATYCKNQLDLDGKPKTQKISINPRNPNPKSYLFFGFLNSKFS